MDVSLHLRTAYGLMVVDTKVEFVHPMEGTKFLRSGLKIRRLLSRRVISPGTGF